MSGADFQRAIALLDAMGPIEASRILGTPVDLRVFIQDNRLDLDEFEIRELKARFRA